MRRQGQEDELQGPEVGLQGPKVGLQGLEKAADPAVGRQEGAT